ncbi:hypothetical protein CERZMDRAFT_119613 [Cercospora zeae-maydis SCOH1-5]|uniref:ABC transporter n=1 Tax=Cercospora zeae-maydis SCOH1-5 TaxID=717836 RepID=A0A6A6FX85_9PEZI|nr:hypothetical protein CERZMDRAFT_119613 [Cercospora zeae-maydis SCOH1-5]
MGTACPDDADALFGPRVAIWCRRFDFTLLFEDVFCTLLPSAVFVLAAALRIAALLARRPHGRREHHHHHRRRLAPVPAVLLAAYVALEAAGVAGALHHAPASGNGGVRVALRVHVAAAAVAVAAALAVASLALAEQWCQRGVARPSMLLGLYLCVRLFLRAVTLRTAWLASSGSAYTHAATAACILHLLVLAGVECEARAGFLDRSLLAWLLVVLRAGFARIITLADLHAAAAAPAAFTTLDAYRRHRPGLLAHSLRCTAGPCLRAVVPRLCAAAFALAQPFLTIALVDYFSRPDKPRDRGAALVAACALLYSAIAVANAWYRTLGYRWATAGRALHTDLIVQKSARLVVDAGAEAQALTMMTSDVQRIVTATSFVHELWAAPLEAGVATWLLWRQLGPSALAALAMALLCALAATLLGRRVGPAQRAWLAASERRVAATRTLLTFRPAVKMMGAEAAVATTIADARQQELAASKPFRTLMVGSVVVSFSTLSLAPVVTFGAYIAIHGAALDAPQLFGSLVLISLLASPLVRVFQIIPHFAAALACIARLEAFLRSDESSAELARSQHQLAIRPVDAEKSSCCSPSPARGTVLIDNVDVRWASQSLLVGINLRVRKGDHVAIMGPVGSGKTTLLRLILGEIAPTKGRVVVDRSIPMGYCAQTPWLENLTAYDNVFQDTAPDDAWREMIVDACAIHPLLNYTSDSVAGEPIGSRGARLSGGERQRLALARAVALRPSMMLLDDCLSAVDRQTSLHIMERLFGVGGILRQLQTTIVQVVNHDRMASFADEIFSIDAGGCLQPDAPSTKPDSHRHHANTLKVDCHSDASGQTSSASPHIVGTTPAGARVPRMSDTQVYRSYFASIGPRLFTVFVICGMLFALALKFPDIWAMWWAEALTKHSSSRSPGLWMGIYALLGCLPLVTLAIWLSLLMLKMVPRSGIEFHAQLLKTVLGATLRCISGSDMGDVMNRFVQDIGLIDSRLPLSLLNTVSGLFLCIAQLFIVVVPAIYLLAALPVLLVVLFLLQTVYLRTSMQVRHLDLQSKAALHASMSELHEGLVTIRAHKLQQAKHKSFLDKLEHSQRPFYLMYMIQVWLQLALNFVVAGLCTAVIGLSVGMRNSTSASGVGLSMLNLVTLGQSLENLIEPWTQMETSLAAIARIKSFEMGTPQERRNANMLDVPVDWPSKGSLDVQGLWVTYSPESDKPNWALRNVAFRVAAGEKVAICGKTGSGKSTLLLSILALLEPTRGAIALDDVDIARVPQEVLRTRIVVVPQEPYLHGDNVRTAVDAGSDEALQEVLQACGLLDKVNAGGGLDSSLSALGLSAGEMQLLVLARAVVHAGKAERGLVLLDESTSSIDHVAAHAMLNLVRNRLSSKTVLAILHDLEAAMQFDRIIVLDGGSIACDGSPAHVLRESSLFVSLRTGRD